MWKIKNSPIQEDFFLVSFHRRPSAACPDKLLPRYRYPASQDRVTFCRRVRRGRIHRNVSDLNSGRRNHVRSLAVNTRGEFYENVSDKYEMRGKDRRRI